MTGHSHFQTSSTFSVKVGKTAEAQLAASVVLQELLEEVIPPRCESDDESEYMATLLLETERTPVTRIRGYFENLSDSKFKKIKLKKYVCGCQFTRLRANYNDAMRESRCLLTCQRMLPIIFNRFNQAQNWLKKLTNQTNRKRFFSQ